MKVFSFTDYRDLIDEFLKSRFGRGAKVKLAEALNCQPGYISQVLGKTKIHFSPENIIKVSQFLGLTTTEEDYLMNLLQKERAGSVELKTHYESKLHKARIENLTFEKQLKKRTSELDEVSKAIYYGHWSYSAIHMLISIPGFNTREKIVKRLQISEALAGKVLRFLLEKDLIQENRGTYSVGETRIHLKKDSPFIKSHHQNFRHKAILSLENENDFDLHYSSVMTLSVRDSIKIRQLVLELITKKDEILIPSPNEELICLNLDLVRL